LRLTDSASAEATLSFELSETRSAFISGAGDPSSAAIIGDAGLHRLDLQTGYWRPREGRTFYVLKHFGSITGSFDDITTNITGGQQVDPNTLLPIPFFAAGVVTDPNAPAKLAMQVTFQGLTAGDANGDHAVDGGDLALMGGAWMKESQTWASCDFNGDGQVDACDLALFGGNWGWSLAPAPPPGAPLPEPASAGLLLAGGLALIGARPRNHRTVG
ncbi:MAG: dockerin type I domain-containing protein, partial [Phycisphaerae bacterium]|nr:dockerin type I domain-containing protein [Phycisphaerae bacterium]